jgi:ABC-type antimicrobial peptide transport system permease subunit
MVGIGTSDPVTIIGVVLILSAVTVSACLTPARRATHLDPMDAIRFE